MNIRKLRSFVKSKNSDILQSNQKVALAMSGGIDSTALFHVFLEFAKKKYFSEFIILHVNFGLRGRSSDADQRFIEALCEQNNVTCKVLKAAKPKSKESKPESIQTWARDIRHKWFKEYADLGYLIALGHNLNDVAENVLFRLARGSSHENLAGMSRLDDHLWRPFIDVTRKDILEAMIAEGLKWREDQSNKTRKYSRNKIRLDVIPVLESIAPGAAEKIAFTGAMLSKVNLKTASNTSNHVSLSLSAASETTRNKVDAIQKFLHSAAFDQKLDLGGGFSLIRERSSSPQQTEFKAPLEIQHLAGLDGYKTELMLSPGDKILTPNTAKTAERFSHAKLNWIEVSSNPPSTRAVAISTPKGDDKVTFAGSKSSFKFKDLMQKWNIRADERTKFLVINYGDGKSVLVKRSGLESDEQDPI